MEVLAFLNFLNMGKTTSRTNMDHMIDPEFFMSVGFEEDFQCFQELWLILDTFHDNDHAQPQHRRKGALVSSINKRDEFIKSREFSNGYMVKKITKLEELRDALILLSPPPRQHLNKKSYKLNTTDLIIEDGDTSPPEILDEVKRFELFRGVIQHEDSLLNERVSWIILAQSFLMAAFITSNGPDSLRYVTAIVGLATVLVTMPAISAAARNIELQQQVYFSGLSSDERSKQLHGHLRDPKIHLVHEHSDRATHGHLFPNMAFRGYMAVPIFYTVAGLIIVQVIGWGYLLMALIYEW